MRKFIFLIFMAGMFQAQAQAQTFDRWEGNRAFERQQMQNDMALRERFDDMRRMQDRLDRDVDYDLHERMHDHNYLMNNGY